MAQDSLRDSIEVKRKLLADKEFWQSFSRAVDRMSDALQCGGQLLIVGNGGSAADAQHFAAELVATLHKEERRGYPAIALNTNSSYLTAWINDADPADVFARQIEAFGRARDVFVGISTSGNSKNIVRAAKRAKELQLSTVGLLGEDGGTLRAACDIALLVPSQTTARIQEAHITIIHMLCEEIIPRLDRTRHAS